MNCDAYKQLISEYVDGRLDRERQGRVQAHLDACPACAGLALDMRTMSGLLRGLPTSQTSAQFESRLAARLAETRPAQRRLSWLGRVGLLLQPQPLLWRPALALGVATAGIAGAALFWHPASLPSSGMASGQEGALITHCVQQHRSYVGSQPLSDIAAQNLANQLDQTAAPIAGETDL